MKILIDTDERFFHRGKTYYSAKVTLLSRRYYHPTVFVQHDLDMAYKRGLLMESRGLIPIPYDTPKKPWWRFWK